MGDKSRIEWTDATWNPVSGCSKVSAGCAHCYAESLSLRYGWSRKPWTPENALENVVLRPERLDQPLRWKRPRVIFVNSMSDLFHELVEDDYIAKVFAVMALARRHTFQVLTKRPERMKAVVSSLGFQRLVAGAATDLLGTRNWRSWQLDLGGQRLAGDSGDGDGWTVEQLNEIEGIRSNLWRPPWPLPNVWLGTSIENGRWVGRADALRATPAAVRFISAEPLLGPLVRRCPDCDGQGWVAGHESGCTGDEDCDRTCPVQEQCDPWVGLDLTGIDWLIVGGESGSGHRPMNEWWVRDLRDRALAAGTAFFFKQWGGRTAKAGGRELDGRTWDDYPQVPA